MNNEVDQQPRPVPTDPDQRATAHAAHTHGPWFVFNDHPTAKDIYYVRLGETLFSHEICTLYGGGNAAMDARLIGAAPDLLAALRACADRMAIAAARAENLAIDEPALVAAVDAIAKAEGSL